MKNNKYISNLVYIKCSKFPKYFEQRCYGKSFCKNLKSSDVTAVSYCWFMRQRFVKSASTDRGTPSMVCCHDACCWMQTWLNRECLPYLRTVLEKCSLHAPRDECSALLASQNTAVLMQSLLNSAWQQGELFN